MRKKKILKILDIMIQNEDRLAETSKQHGAKNIEHSYRYAGNVLRSFRKIIKE